jgi:hypothetical protein
VFGVIRAGARRGGAWVATLRLCAAAGSIAIGVSLALRSFSGVLAR